MTIITFKQIKKTAKWALEEFKNSDYDNIGIRVQDDTHGLAVGDTIERNSVHWSYDDGQAVSDGTLLEGVCAIDATLARYIGQFGGYEGRVMLVLGSESAYNREADGGDAGEIVMERPIVLAICTGNCENIQEGAQK
jgi:hypothetical protein